MFSNPRVHNTSMVSINKGSTALSLLQLAMAARAARAVAATAVASGAGLAAVVGRLVQMDPPRVDHVDLSDERSAPHAADAVARTGMCVLHSALVSRGAESGLAQLVREVDVSAAGAAAAMLLPTVHQADAHRNAQRGAMFAQKAVAAAVLAWQADAPSAAGVSQALKGLSPYLEDTHPTPRDGISPRLPFSLLSIPDRNLQIRTLDLHPRSHASVVQRVADAFEAPQSAGGDPTRIVEVAGQTPRLVECRGSHADLVCGASR